MYGGVPKAWTRRSRVKLSTALQETLLDAIANNAELPQNHREQSPERGDLAQDVTPVQAPKRRLDTTTESDSLPAKRCRLTRTDAQQPEIEDKSAEKAAKTTLQQPKPKRPYASFLKDFVDPVHTGRHPASVYTFVSEWLESVGSDRERRCRSDSHLSDSHLHHSDGDPISRQLTRSAPEMDYPRDADGFAIPPMPSSYRASRTGSVTPSDLTPVTRASGRSSASRLVEDPDYRVLNLAANNIYIRHPFDPLPEHIASLVDHVRQDRDSPGPSLDEVRQDEHLYNLSMGAGEPEIESDRVRPIDSAAFSIAMSGTEARLYVSWKHNEQDFYMANVKSFLLQDPEHYLEFRKYVRNIIDWGKDKRLQDIRNSLDCLLVPPVH
ncbi:hypothetical protein G6O67_001078 [Ophiocordyceps sinensis]|uniref:DUF7924 domain-containing protein n=1 Tax=Ophiocordyceps sinensis TaxID=72228 RepID=A0A8H4PWP5_9HYPO|nr:hypothetical protein G6O67_001078 [Ophiocordyceps sinensis]